MLLFKNASVLIAESLRGAISGGRVDRGSVGRRSAGEPLVCGVPMLLPVGPWVGAFEVLGLGDPPVPLTALPFESMDPPAVPPPPTDDPAAPPPEVCAIA